MGKRRRFSEEFKREAVDLAENDRRDEAIRSYEMALSIRPGYA